MENQLQERKGRNCRLKIEIRLKGPKNNEFKKEEKNKGCVIPRWPCHLHENI